MATIKVSTLVPQTRELREADPTGKTWVKIKPPGFEQEMERARLTTSRSYRLGEVQVNHNSRLLMADEIWLTYAGTNLEVEIVLDEEGNSEIVKFKPPGETNRGEFMDSLLKLPPKVVNEWHAMVMDVVPEWNVPF